MPPQATECGQRVSRTIPMTLALGLALTSDLLTRPMLATESADQPREDHRPAGRVRAYGG